MGHYDISDPRTLQIIWMTIFHIVQISFKTSCLLVYHYLLAWFETSNSWPILKNYVLSWYNHTVATHWMPPALHQWLWWCPLSPSVLHRTWQRTHWSVPGAGSCGPWFELLQACNNDDIITNICVCLYLLSNRSVISVV